MLRSLELSLSPVTLGFTLYYSHWATQGVRLQVCNQETDSGPLLNCQDLDNNGQPGPTTVTLPPSTSTSPTNARIVFTVVRYGRKF